MSPNLTRALLPLIISATLAACGAPDTAPPAPTPGPEPTAGEPAATPTEDISPAPWDAARDRGAAWRGIGQEPGWTVEIHPGQHIVYVGDYGQTSITLPAPEPQQDGVSNIWHVSGDGNDLRVMFEELPCQDIMSGEEMPFTVTITVNGEELRGCGRRL
jgi:uncharacterized membrane protein